MAKYIKLGNKASIFYDPTTKVKVLKGQVVELKNRERFSKKILTAIAGGHLVSTNKEQYNDYLQDAGIDQALEKSTKEITPTSWIEPWIENNDLDEKNLMKLKKAELIQLAQYYETELTVEELDSYEKKDIVEEILEIIPEEEDDEE